MAGGCGMKVVPKNIFIRIDIFSLGRVSNVHESVVLRICGDPVGEAVNIEPVKRHRDALTRQGADGGIKLGIELISISSGRRVQSSSRFGIVVVVRHETERRDVRHEDRNDSGAPQFFHQSRDPLRRAGDVFGAVIVEKIVRAAPDDIKRSGVDGLIGQIIIHLLAEVIDRDRQFATEEGNGVVNDGNLASTLLRGGAAESVVSAAVQAVRWGR